MSETVNANLYIDWDRDGSFSVVTDDYTDRVISLDLTVGLASGDVQIASVGQMTAVLSNTDRELSPANASSRLYGLLLPGAPVKVTVQSDALAETTLFLGKVSKISLSSGHGQPYTVEITAEDAMADFQGANQLHIPPMRDRRPDELVQVLTAAVYEGSTAWARIAWANTATGPASTSALNLNGKAYTFTTTPTSANQISLSGTKGQSIERAIHAESLKAHDTAPDWGSGTERCEDAAASYETGAGGTTTISASGGTARFIGTMAVTGAVVKQAQTFIPTAGVISQITVKLGANTGTPTGTMTWEVWSDLRGAPGVQLKSGTFTPTASATNTISVTTGPGVRAEQHWLILYSTVAQTAGNGWNWQASAVSSYANGEAWSWNSTISLWTESTVDAECSVTTVAGTLVTFYAAYPGSAGNGLTFSATPGASGSFWSSGTTFAGGDDGINTDLIDFDTSDLTIPMLGDTWEPGQTNGMDALTDVVNSERGYFFVSRGVLTFRNKSWWFTRNAETAALTIDNTFSSLGAALDTLSIFNQVSVNYRGRRDLSDAVVARANGDLWIPGTRTRRVWYGNGLRRATEQAQAAEGVTYIESLALPLTDFNSGNPARPGTIVHPVPGTDFDVFDEYGFDYTASDRITTSLMVSGRTVVVNFSNSATGALKVVGFVIRATGIQSFEPCEVLLTDWDSVDLYGLRAPKSIDMPFVESQTFAQSVGEYVLGQWSTPTLRVEQVVFDAPNDDLEDLFTLDLGDVIALTDGRTGLSAARFMVLGMSITFDGYRASSVALTVERIDDSPYFVLDDATYGDLDGVNRLSL